MVWVNIVGGFVFLLWGIKASQEMDKELHNKKLSDFTLNDFFGVVYCVILFVICGVFIFRLF